MSADYDTEINRLWARLQKTRDHNLHVPLLEAMVALADMHQIEEHMVAFRDYLIQAATFSGYQEKALVAFAWRLAYHDRQSPDEESQDLLWKYKWITANLSRFLSLSRVQINAAMDDMERRFTRAGYGLRAVYQVREENAWRMGDTTAAIDFAKLATKAKSDTLDDCAACQTNNKVTALLSRGDVKRAIKTAEPLVTGKKGCAEVPQLTYGTLLLPLAQLGEWDTAYEYHRRNLAEIRTNNELLDTAAQHVQFMAIIGDLAGGTKLATGRLRAAMESRVDQRRFDMLLACRLLALRCRHEGKKSLRFRLPDGFPGATESHRYTPDELAALLLAPAKQLADAFDARNGNRRFNGLIAESDGRTALFTSYEPAAET